MKLELLYCFAIASYVRICLYYNMNGRLCEERIWAKTTMWARMKTRAREWECGAKIQFNCCATTKKCSRIIINNQSAVASSSE